MPISRRYNYHYEASCTCSKNYVEYNLQCIENPCLNYKCYDYGYCEVVENECSCKDGYVEYTGDYLYNEDGSSYLSDTTLTCVPTRDVWNWVRGDAECSTYSKYEQSKGC